MKKTILLLISSLALTTSCSDGLKSSLGLKKQAPDEFTVVTYPHLSVPPADDAETAKHHINHHATHSHHISSQEQHLLNKIDQGLKTPEKIEKSDEVKSDGPVVNPKLEKERIDANLKEGKSVAEGEVKTEQKSKSLLNSLFGR